MFDIGFWEISLIMVVALLVIGPERLPGVARKAGLWVNKGRGFIRSIKADIEHEIAADELKKVLKEQSKSSGVHEIIEEARDDIRNVKEELKNNIDDKSVEESAPEVSIPEAPIPEVPMPETIGHSSEGTLDKPSSHVSDNAPNKNNEA